MVTLPTVEIPGYREALQRERHLRDTAFLGGFEIVCGVEVKPLSLRTLLLLEFAGNGYVNPCYFDNDNEALAHALQVIYFCQPSFKAPQTPKYHFWSEWIDAIKQNWFLRKITKGKKADVLLSEIKDWIADAFMDAPSGQATGYQKQSYASYPAYVLDLFGEAGLMFSEDQIMDMPLKKLWQHWRVSVHRLHGAVLTNPSDEIAVEKIK